MAAYGWPDIMRTSIAAEYIGGSKWMVLRAVEAGLLRPVGRLGRTFTFSKASLDAYLAGEPLASGAANTHTAATPRRSSSTGSSADALDRIATIAKSGRSP